MKKRLLSAVLAFCMMLSLLPSNATAYYMGKAAQPSAILAGKYRTAYLDRDGALWMWGMDITTPEKAMDGVVKVVTGASLGSYGYNYYAAAIKTDSSLWVWQENAASPAKLMDNVADVYLSGYCGAAIKTDGTLWTWGWNECGQLGDGSVDVSSDVPTKVLDNVISVSMSETQLGCTAAIKTDGTLWMWGSNYHGQLGNGGGGNHTFSTGWSCQTTPIKVMDDVSNVYIHGTTVAAIKNDNTLWMWGSGDEGQLGNGTNKKSDIPYEVLDNVASVSLNAAGNVVAAVKLDNTLWMWGNNDYGQLGNNSNTSVNLPVHVLNDVMMVDTEGYVATSHTAAIKTDGTLWMWGDNSRGELGNGGIGNITGSYAGDEWVYQTIPAKILDDIASISLGTGYTTAIKNDGTLWVWGQNIFGELGIGTTQTSYIPIQIFKKEENPNPQTKTGFFMYDSALINGVANYNYFYNEEWFYNTGYQHELAQMSIRLAMAAASTSPKNVMNLYDQLGFDYTDDSINYPTPRTDSIGYAIGNKKITNGNNQTATLIVVAVRGAGYEQEWADNFNVGTTSEHAGFSRAADTVASAVQNYIKINGIEGDVKIWITGFSRAAATSNIAAQRFNILAKNGGISGLSADDIFAYCFECPRTVRTNDPSYAANIYNNIFNIVNHIDIVPKVAPEAWDYDRYGITYYVPSSEQTIKYSNAYNKMLDSYIQIASIAGIANADTVAKENTKQLKEQGDFFNKAIGKVASYFESPYVFAGRYQDIVMNLLKALNGGSYESGTVFKAFFEGMPSFASNHPIVTAKLIANVGNLAHAHYPELCLAWMDSLNGESNYVGARTRELIMNCPVDISVFDSQGTLVAQILNNQVTEIKDSTIAAYIDEDDQKVIILPTDDEFSINVIATDSGTVTYTAIEYNVDSGATEKVISYYEVNVEENDTLVGLFENLDRIPSASYPLYVNDSTDSLTPSVTQTGEAVQNYTITVSASGNGTITGGGYYGNGEFAKVTATADHGETFLGWYVGNEKISSDAEYRFLVKEDVDIIAKFTTNTTPNNPSKPLVSSGGGGSSSSNNYIINIPSRITGGTVTVRPTSASEGSKVTITAKPNSGYEVGTVTVTDKDGKQITVTDAGDSKYTFTMPKSKVDVKVEFVCQQTTLSFDDVQPGAYYADAVAWAVEKGITAGTSATTFSPNSLCTRAQIVTFLWRAAGSPKASVDSPFIDVPVGSYYYDAVLWAVEQGITSGTSATTFSPDATCTRGQAVTFLYRHEKSPVVSGSNAFTDVPSDAYYAKAVQWAVSNGVTAGTSATTFNPDATCTRGQIVTFLYRDMA